MKKLLITIIIYVLAMSAQAQTILLQETFDNNTLPVGWTIDSAGVTPVNGWQFSGSPIISPGNGFDNSYPRVYGNSILKKFDCNLTSTIINASGYSSLFLSFSDQCPGIQINGRYCLPKVEVSNDSGVTWTQAFSIISEHYPIRRSIVDLTNYAAGYSNVKIRFRFYEFDSGWWAIDSVVVADSISCVSPPDSGFTQSDVTYGCTGTGANFWIEDLSRGLGQTYQWQIKNAASGNVWSNISGATNDSLSATQNGTTYYQCLVTCGGLTTHSQSFYLTDTPRVGGFYSKNLNMICSAKDDTIAMSLLIPYGGPGVGYQWMYSYNYLQPYTDIPGATNDYYVVSAANYSQSTYFKCKQICLSSGTTRPINIYNWVNEIINPNPMCYCFAPTGNHCSNGNYLINVSIQGTTFNYTDSCVDTLGYNASTSNYVYHDPVLHPNATAKLLPGNTYTLEATNTVENGIVMWIDYNHDLEFDSTEWVDPVTLMTANVPYQFNFTVPGNATLGQTGMRVRTYGFSGSKSDPCGYSDGNTKDYMVSIDSTVSVNNLVLKQTVIRIYPNPANDKLTVISNQIISTAKLHGVTGSVVKEQANVNSKKVVFDVSALPAGIYFAEVVTDKGMVVRKWVRE